MCGWCGTSGKLGAGGVLARHPGLDGTVCQGVGTPPGATTAPVPRGKCGVCGTVQKLTRETGQLQRHGGCAGVGSTPTERVVAADRRRRVAKGTNTPVVPAPKGAQMVTREEVAVICSVSIRTVSRWTALGYLTLYEDSRGRVAYARVQAEAMNLFEPVQ